MSTHKVSEGFEQALASIPACTLDGETRRQQMRRYQQLASTLTGVVREPEAVHVDFDTSVDHRLARELIAVERDCCPFLTFGWDARARRLSVSVSEPELRPALDAVEHAFTGALR